MWYKCGNWNLTRLFSVLAVAVRPTTTFCLDFSEADPQKPEVTFDCTQKIFWAQVLWGGGGGGGGSVEPGTSTSCLHKKQKTKILGKKN